MRSVKLTRDDWHLIIGMLAGEKEKDYKIVMNKILKQLRK